MREDLVTHGSSRAVMLRPCPLALSDERGHPVLFIEVLSPDTARFDRVVKRERYLRAGIEYWIVDLDSRLVERWLPGEDRPTIHAVELVWTPSGASAPLVIALEPFFTEVLGAVEVIPTHPG